MPDSYATTSAGRLMIANGVDPMLVWDGLSDIQPAGITPPAAALILGYSGRGAIAGTYFAYVRYLDAAGNTSNLSPLAGPVNPTGAAIIVYADVPTPSEPKVVRRQILRNTSGQAGVFYVDLDVNDVTSTTFYSNATDNQLLGGLAVPLLDSNGNLLANTYNPPPAHKSVIAQHLDRMFAACEVSYAQGSVAVTFGSTTVQGVGTEWPASLAGRYLYVNGAAASYLIDSVNPLTQVLTLDQSYASASNPYAGYAIRPAPGEARLVYYSLAGQPEAWPLTQALSIQEDDDDFTGLMPKGSFIFILERRHIYRFTFQNDPATDGFVYLSTNRGSVNNRCWVIVDQHAYMLDEAGVYRYAGSEVEPLSAPIQDLFEPEGATSGGGDSVYKINWAAQANFHASYHPGQNVIRWFVALAGSDFPRHALCLELAEARWWIEEYPVPIGASALARYQGEPRVFLGGPGGQVLLFGEGQLDAARVGPTLRGTATAAGLLTLTDSGANFDASVVGAPVCVVSGRGRGQRRIITNATPTQLSVAQPWLIRPDATSVYQVGGIQWRFLTKEWRYKDSDSELPRRLELLFEPCFSQTQIQVELFQDRGNQPVPWGVTTTQADYQGFATVEGDPVLLGDLSRPNGFLQKRLDGFKDLYADGPRFMQLQLSGVIDTDVLRIFSLAVDGVS